LDADPDHLEAGFNLAVVEAKTRRLEAAAKRIKHLQELYPDNPALADMIRRLRK
jgi:thioredoxin-like negative regulator of GroEL